MKTKKTKGRVDLLIGGAFLALAATGRPYDWTNFLIGFLGTVYAAHGWVTSKNF